MNKPRVIFRANGGTQIGLGHLVRCSALASILRNDFHTTLIVRSDLPTIVAELNENFDSIQSIDSLSAAAESDMLLSFKDALLVLDGYGFDLTYQQKLKTKAAQLVCIDDIHQYPFLASVIINHGGGASAKDYDASAGCQFYLGPAYALLRKPFLKKVDRTLKNQNLFMCLGGADPHNYTQHILSEALAQKKYTAIDVVVGHGYQHAQNLRNFSSKHPHVKLHQGISAEEIARLMQSCTYGVCSPSSVAYEYLSVGSVLFLMQTADNQTDIYNYLVTSGFAFDWKNRSAISETQIENAIHNKQQIFDGGQEKRLRNIFLALHTQQQVVVRRAITSDMKLCYDWANDPQVRQNSYHQEPIAWETHVAWFHARLSDEHAYFYILEHNGVPMAQVRFQVEQSTAVLNYLIDVSYRGKGLGTMVVSSGVKKFLEDFKKQVTIHAHVKFSNPASQRAFEKMKFEKQISTGQAESFTYILAYHGSTSGK